MAIVYLAASIRLVRLNFPKLLAKSHTESHAKSLIKTCNPQIAMAMVSG